MRIAAALAVTLSTTTCGWSQFSVLDGEHQAIIVYETDATGETVQAHKDLAAYLQRATGQSFQAMVEDQVSAAEGALRLYVGRCEALPDADKQALDKMDRDAYLVDITPDGVFLAGPRPWSTYWAVCQFLEDCVGVRWLIPGPLGEDVPHHQKIVVPVGRTIYSPAVLSRLWSGAHYGGVWSLRQRIHGRYRFHHNLLHVFDATKYYDEHPDWYPLRIGKRYRPGKEDHSWQPCFATESSVKHAADVARAAFAADPDLESFSYGCNDGQGWCECAGCKAMDRKMEPWDGFEGTYSYRFYGWLNKVAAELEKTDPDKLLGCLAYSTYILPPERIGLHKNIIPYLTSNRADYFEPEFRQQDQKLLEWWGRVANQVGIYDYAYGMGFAIPRLYNHLFQEALQHAVKNNVRGFYAEVYPNWGLDGPKLYVMSRILRDPEVDIDALTSDWNDRMFREAAEPMKKYFARCERAWAEQKTGKGHWAYRLAADPKQFEVFPPAAMDECTKYLDQAAAFAKDDLVKRRLHFFRKTWEVTLLLSGQYWAAREVQDRVDNNAPVEQVAEALRRMATRLSTVDIDAYIAERVGDDPIAFHPPKPSWIAPLKGGAETNAKRWTAARLAGEIVEQARASGQLDAAKLREQIGKRVDTILGTGGPEAYRGIVDQIRAMAQKVATVVKTDRPVKVDGLLNDAVWQRADEMTGFSKWGQVAPSAYATKAWLAHDGTNLYVALECTQETANLHVEAAPRDGNTWHDDSVEFFINPVEPRGFNGMTEFPYIQFIINAKGAFFDQWGQNDEQTYQERLAANFNCEWGARVEQGKWAAEMKLPLAEFGCSPKDYPLLRVDLVRNVQGAKEEISAWFPSVGAHADPLSRGWIVFE